MKRFVKRKFPPPPHTNQRYLMPIKIFIFKFSSICETDFFDILLTLFREYRWNNFLHTEVEKCLHTIFYNSSPNNANNNTTQPTSNNSPKNADIKFLDDFMESLKTNEPELSNASKEHIRTHVGFEKYKISKILY